MNGKKLNGLKQEGRPSSRASRRKMTSLLSLLASIEDKRLAGPATNVRPLRIGDWRVADAERRVAIFNGIKGS